MKKKDIAWGSLEPKPIDNPKVFILEGDPLKGATPRPPPKKKTPEMFFKKGGLVKKAKGKRKKYI